MCGSKNAAKFDRENKMHPYALLGIAIVTEVAGTSALKLSDGMTKLLPSMVVVIGYGLSFWLLALALKPCPSDLFMRCGVAWVWRPSLWWGCFGLKNR